MDAEIGNLFSDQFTQVVPSDEFENDLYTAIYLNYKRSGLSIAEIASFMDKSKYPDEAALRTKVSRKLNSLTHKTIKGKRVENKESLYKQKKKGVFVIRERRNIPTIKPAPKGICPPTPTYNKAYSLFCGKAGEYAVASELLFRGYNISSLAVDDGIDVVAIKDGKTFYIQVKTSVLTGHDNAHYSISKKSYERYNKGDCFYIFVVRGTNKNAFIVAATADIEHWLSTGDAPQSETSISINVTQRAGSLYVGDNNVKYLVDNFEKIK